MRQISGFSLWLGHIGDIRDLRTVLSTGIQAVVDLALNEPPASLPREIVYCRFPLVDGTGNPPWVIQNAIVAVVQLLRCGTPTLVYCGAGMSRSPAIAAAAIAEFTNMPASEALALVTEGGSIDIHPGMWKEILGSIK